MNAARKLIDRLLGRMTRQYSALLLVLIACFVGLVVLFVMRDIQGANADFNALYSGSMDGLQRLGDLQYDAQETRRSTLYALSTADSNRQLEYADQSRAAEQRVKEQIALYIRQARSPHEKALGERLDRDWDSYLGVRDDSLALILEGSIREAVDLDLSRGVPAFDRVRRDLQDMKSFYDQEASSRLQHEVTASRRSSERLMEILVFTLLLSFAAVWAVQRGRILSTLELARLQMEFVASVSHELRTPLAVLRSASDNIVDGLVRSPEDLREYGNVLQNQSRRMSELVDEILLFASTEDGKQRYNLRPVPVEDLIAEVRSSTDLLLRQAGFVLRLDVDSGLPPVLGDPAALRQCLQNLIANAIKYGGESRSVTLRARASISRPHSSPVIQISIVDHGIGIERSELEKIFDPFYRSPRVIAAQIHGTGLGLPLARRIAEAMAGSITVISEPAQGSTFTLHIPAADQPALFPPLDSAHPGAL